MQLRQFLKKISFAMGVLIAVGAPASEKIFRVGGAATQQIVQFENVSEVETFTGKTSKVVGVIKFDVQKKSGSGTVTVEAASLDTGFAKRNDQLWSAEWLDVKKYPKITFQAMKVQRVTDDNYKIAGKFTLHGVTRHIELSASVKQLKENEATRKAGLKGDVLQIKTGFKIKFTDYGIKIPNDLLAEMSPDVSISVTLYAQSGLSAH